MSFECTRLAVVCALAFAGACGGEGEPAVTPPEAAGFGGVWSEFLTAAQVLEILPLLEERGVAVHLAWEHDSPDEAALLSLVRDASGVEVRPWLLLDEIDGYWPGSTNAHSYDAAARQLMDSWDAEGLTPTTLLVDMELRFDKAVELQNMLSAPEPDLLAIVALLRDNMDAQQFAEATSVYAALVDDAHARGWQVALTTLPQMLDDYADGDDDLRQAFGIPIDGIAWDTMTFQAYRTLFGDLLAGISETSLTPFFVYDYARMALELFGERGGVDIGLVGAGVTPSSTYVDGADLMADVEAALSAGVPRERINVYNLDGIVARPPSDAWLAVPATDPAPPPEDDATADSHSTNATLDGVL